LIWGGVGALLTLLGLGLLTSRVASLSEGPNAVRGKVVLESLNRYQEVRPIVWGLATTTPALALLIPEAEWGTLSKEDQESLTWYLEGLIPAVRADPDRYVEEFRATPIYQTLRTKVAGLCADCWLIGIGNLALDEKSIFFGKVIVQGNSLWKKAPPSSRGMRASEFRAG